MANFNTSHVVVYPKNSLQNKGQKKFQYISCCSLSMTPKVAAVRRKEFQYISCCSLSLNKHNTGKTYIHFNTSHVVVYRGLQKCTRKMQRFQYISCCSLSIISALAGYLVSNFNTSHVVVYQHKNLAQCTSLKISIHLML